VQANRNMARQTEVKETCLVNTFIKMSACIIKYLLPKAEINIWRGKCN